ncbi:EpsG family protein [Elizabethkingia sp. JS20170427COW]|uniref:EpsG family protein n=1 Tax=Elizabethkingia sp. JS20170427COW TaxID=2583851 RepID=UPI001110CD32|nr:EpsG family protein [Elizabethkingia sp. JS20170427COW]QCX53301.1 EpsG family protein [Elizabethkingia sp. JS20170427COW]
MAFLHPVFAVIFLFLLFCTLMEVYGTGEKKSWCVWIAGIMLVIVGGFRFFVGADYPIYNNLFHGFSTYISYQDVFDKAFFQDSKEQIEWIFVLLNKWIYDLGMPFYIVTFVMAVITVSLKLSTIYKNVAFPAMAILFYYMPVVFFEDFGQMRQGIGIAICVFSFRYIKSRNLPMFMLMMYLALGFHKTSIVFIPAYWIVKIPMNSYRIFLAIAISIILAPFEVYRLVGPFLENMAPQDIAGGYMYIDDAVYGQTLETGLTDIVKIFFILVIIIYDKEACEKVLYYEYMRNLGVFGFCLFYLLRMNSIFAVRLPGAYMFFATMFLIPNIMYAVKDEVKRVLYLGFTTYLIAMYFYFGKGSGQGGNFGPNYQNVLWLK